MVLNLTEQGLINYKAHEEYHRQTNDRAMTLLKEMPDCFYQYMLEYFSAFYNIVDAFFIGRLGTLQTVAVSVVYPLTFDL